MNILIVDDNKNNRMILRLLLEDYMDEHEGIDFFIDEAEDGQVAVDKCNEKDFDIVLMDIMMPNMDGIEATRIIRQKHKKIMIIAVSAVDDSEHKKFILNNGAEDYIAKPVNVDMFVGRMANYITIVQAREHRKISSSPVNLFTEKIYTRHTKFILDSEDSLAEFWEFFLVEAKIKSNYLSDVVRTITYIVEKQIQINHNNNELYIEETEDNQYFTLINIDEISKKTIELILTKNTICEDYILTDAKLCFELKKEKQYIREDEIYEPIVTKTIIKESIDEIVSPLNLIASVELSVFDYMDSDDLYDLEESANKLNSIMLIVGGGEVTEEEVTDIYTYLDRLGSILATYSEVYPIAQALTGLSIDMSSHVQEFMEHSEALGPMCKAFSNDMSNWIEQSFHTGAPSAEFMNDTIVVNCQTIGSMLKIDEAPPAADDDFDDIFDF